jgi:geranylgeranylglycerol-phosphate geranylgeranyltransferase
MRSRIVAVFELVRFPNAVGAGLSVLLGAYLSGRLSTGTSLGRTLLASAVGLLVTAGTNALNDYYDVDIDSVNKPARPLPSNRLSLRTAWTLGLLLLGAALVLATWLGLAAFSAASLLTAMAYLYNVWLKRTLLANPWVGLLCALSIVYGGAILNAPSSTIVPAMLVFLFMTSREILKTVEDYEGDMLAQARTFATILGPNAALRLYFWTLPVVVGASLVPYVTGQFGPRYMIAALAGVDLVIVATMVPLAKRPARSTVERTLFFTRLSFFAGLLAMFLGCPVL